MSHISNLEHIDDLAFAIKTSSYAIGERHAAMIEMAMLAIQTVADELDEQPNDKPSLTVGVA